MCTVSAADAPAGIVGCLGGTAAVPNKIENCYSVGIISGNMVSATFVGVIVGKNNQKGSDCEIVNSFFNTDSASIIPGSYNLV